MQIFLSACPERRTLWLMGFQARPYPSEVWPMSLPTDYFMVIRSISPLADETANRLLLPGQYRALLISPLWVIFYTICTLLPFLLMKDSPVICLDIPLPS